VAALPHPARSSRLERGGHRAAADRAARVVGAVRAHQVLGLRPGIPGVSDRIRVVSIVGRFLEHSRLFYFANGGDEQFYFGSADWMPRNFDRRVEAVAPVDDVSLHVRLHSLLNVCLADNRQAWDLAADGTYTQRMPRDGEPERATHKLLLADPWGMVKPADQRPVPATESARFPETH